MISLFFAELFSFMFHPVVFSLMTPFFVVYRETYNEKYALKWAIFTALFIGLFIVTFGIGRVKGIFSDIDVSKRSERTKFYLILCPFILVYILLSFLFKGIFFPLLLIAVGMIFGLILYEVVTLKIKASMHVGIAVAWAITMGILYGPLVFMISCSIIPIVIWARLRLKRHSVSEIVAGGALGAVITFLSFFLGKVVYNVKV